MSKRAEQRRMMKDAAKNTKTYTLTNADIKRIKNEAVSEASQIGFILMLGLPLMAMRDEFGFGKVRLERLIDKVLELYEAFNEDYFTLEDLMNTIKDETGVEFKRS